MVKEVLEEVHGNISTYIIGKLFIGGIFSSGS